MNIQIKSTFRMTFSQFKAMKKQSELSENGKASFNQVLPNIEIIDAPLYFRVWQLLKKLGR